MGNGKMSGMTWGLFYWLQGVKNGISDGYIRLLILLLYPVTRDRKDKSTHRFLQKGSCRNRGAAIRDTGERSSLR